MTDKPKVKVLKKAVKDQPSVGASSAKTARLAAREMVSNVSDWVSEFKSRRADESRHAFEKFFSNQPRPSES